MGLRDSERQLQFLRELLTENAWIDGDVVELAKDTWAIHGVFPYDGEVPMGVVDTYVVAKYVLDEVRGNPAPDERS